MPPNPVFLQPCEFLRASGTWLGPVVPIPVPMNTRSPGSPGPCPSQHRLDPCLACLNGASNLVLPWAPSPIRLPVEKTSHAKKKKNKPTQRSELARPPAPTASPADGQSCWVLSPPFLLLSLQFLPLHIPEEEGLAKCRCCEGN